MLERRGGNESKRKKKKKNAASAKLPANKYRTIPECGQ
jgi:hypothetical protein